MRWESISAEAIATRSRFDKRDKREAERLVDGVLAEHNAAIEREQEAARTAERCCSRL